MDLYGVTVRRKGSDRQQLSVAYVGLFVDPVSSHVERATGSRVSPLSKRVIGDLLAKEDRLVIRGYAGSGNSTLLRWIAVNAAQRSLPALLAKRNMAIPFLIRLRYFVDTKLPRPEDFLSYAADAIEADMPKGWVRKYLMSGQALLLVDGVDEVSRQRRNEVRTWLKDLVKSFDKAQFVVTSRPEAIDEGWMYQERFVEATLRPMDLDDTYTFLDHWHNAVREELADDENEQDRLVPLAAKLKKDVAETASLRNLTRAPLLCAAICALNRERNQHVPKERLNLYRAFCEMLLERRELEQGLGHKGLPDLTLSQKMALLQHLAYWMMRNRSPIHHTDRAVSMMVEREEAITRFNEISVNLAITDDGSRILEELLERSGIIREPVPGAIDFLHRTFQEYLSALAVIDADDIGLLLEKAPDDQWQEVIVIAAGIAQQRQRNQIFNGLIERGNKIKQSRHQYYLLG